MYDIRLSIFITVAEKGSFSAAAEALHITQPAISARINSLEDFFGVQLFKRDRKGVTMTQAGETLYKHAKQINDLWEQTVKEVRLHSNIYDSKLEIMGSPTVGHYMLPTVIKEFKEKYDYIHATIFVGNNNEVISKIFNNELYLGFIAGHCTQEKLIVEELFGDELILVVSKKHPWAKRKVIDPIDVLNDRLILREPGAGTSLMIEEKFKKLGIDIIKNKFFLELGSIEAIKASVEINNGCSIISRYAVAKEIAAGTLVEVGIKNMKFSRPISAIYKNYYSLPEIYKKFLTYIKKNSIPL